MAHDPTILRLEAELKAAIKVAQAAQNKLSAARDRADLPDPQSFYTSAEVNEIYKANHAEWLAVVPAIVNDVRGVNAVRNAGLAAAAARYANPGTWDAAMRAQMAWVAMMDTANEIVKAQARGEQPSLALAQDFLKANAIAAGRVVELPVDETARAIIRAGARRRGEKE
jgi:hypothetical protein